MHKLAITIIMLILSFSSISCVTYTVNEVRYGNIPTQDNGHLIVNFTRKSTFLSLSNRKVYIILKQLDTNQIFYLPFGDNSEIHIIDVIPGKYRIDDFIYMSGIGANKGVNTTEYGKAVLYNPPEHFEAKLLRAQYPEKYKKEFVINKNQTVYIGDYSWEKTTGYIKDKDVTIIRKFSEDDELFTLLKKFYPTIPDDLDIIPLAENE